MEITYGPYVKSYYQNETPSKGKTEEGADGSKKEEGASKTPGPTDPKVMELQVIDTHVRAHESAHISAGGGVVSGGANFSYERGPDGKLYAVAGEVPIDAGEASTPEETITKAQRIRSAALAPSDPSPQDYKVAAMATMMEQSARIEKMRELQSQLEGIKRYSENSLAPAGVNSEPEPPIANIENLAS